MTPRKVKTSVSVPLVLPEMESPAALSLPRFSSWNRFLIYPLCILFPGGAFVLAALYIRQNDKNVSRFGKICLALGVLGAIVRIWRSAAFQSIESSDALTQSFY
jgi:hypothetical protein